MNDKVWKEKENQAHDKENNTSIRRKIGDMRREKPKKEK